MLLPACKRTRVKQKVVGNFGKMGEMVVVVAAEQFIGGSSTDRNAVTGLGNGLLKRPLCVVSDGEYRRVMLINELSQAVEKTIGANRHLGVPDTELANRKVDHVFFFVARIGVHDSEAVHIETEDAACNTDQGIGINSPAHAESKRHVGT